MESSNRLFVRNIQTSANRSGHTFSDVHRIAISGVTRFRKGRRESQRAFWARFGVTQSRGSRFESGTEMPLSVRILLDLYFKGIISDSDLQRVSPESHPKRNLRALILDEWS